MRVTDISPQQRNAYIFNVYVDGEFKFGLSDVDLRRHDIHIGSNLTQTQIKYLYQLSLASKAYNYCLHYIARRPRSRGEVSDYLIHKGYGEDITTQVINRLFKNKLLDDVEFAKIWVENRILLKPTSKRRLEQELRQKKIDPDIIAQTIARLNQDTEIEQASHLIRKKIKNPSYSDRPKLVSYMLRQGFSYDVVKKALELTTSEN